MIGNSLTKIFGSYNDRLLKKYKKIVNQINNLGPSISNLNDTELRDMTAKFKQYFFAEQTLENILPEAFSVVREASYRVMNMKHFDSQLIGGIALHEGKIAEMGTGEGKTLTATLPVYLNALTGHGVHVVTVNDYLASRDAEWMGKLYKFLGLTVGVNLSCMNLKSKQQAYQADITYGTSNEFGFDYLRDNMIQNVEQRVQRGLCYAIVDEVDSILIDEARNPLIISGEAENHAEIYIKMNSLPKHLKRQNIISKNKNDATEEGDYIVDEKNNQIILTESGHEKAELILAQLGFLKDNESLYAASNITLMHHVYNSLKAHTLFHRNQHYILKNERVVIVDEFTGRLMPGRRWSEGLHQAIEAKENVEIQCENQTLATITFQNYFRMYDKLSGMTGTAATEACEFQEIYRLETIIIPPNKKCTRIDLQDQIYTTSKEKYHAVVRNIQDCYNRTQPVLVGTTSIENSELISRLLNQLKLPHQVLNAKHHAHEAEIIAQAGRPKMITIATNMAGRGTDIILGGSIVEEINKIYQNLNLSQDEKHTYINKIQNEWKKLHNQVISAGGLHVIGTERHESRRIDNQLRGRSGRQGDPGSSRFYLSLDDSLLRIFSGEKLRNIMNKLGVPENEPIESGIVTRSIENAQRKVELYNFDIRKQLLQYDDVSNEQRKVIYFLRNQILESNDLYFFITNLISSYFQEFIQEYTSDSMIDRSNFSILKQELEKHWNLKLDIDLQNQYEIETEEIIKIILEKIESQFKKENICEKQHLNHLERSIILNILDIRWREHLITLDHLRQGIHLRGYAQKNPKQEYHKEAFVLFEELLALTKNDIVHAIIDFYYHIEKKN